MRRSSVAERIAGDAFGFSTGDELEESESVLSKYFPELSLRVSSKSSRGSRLGRSPQTAEQVTTYTPREASGAQGGGTASKNYDSDIAGFKQTLLEQSELLKKLTDEKTKKPEGGDTGTGAGGTGAGGTGAKDTTKTLSPEQSAVGEITQMYQDLLGRAPEAQGLSFWLGEGRAAGGITPEEKTSLQSDFMKSTEYQLKQLYKQELNREPDPEGYKFWASDPRASDGLDAGEIEQLRQSFRQSPEYMKKKSA